MIDLASQTLDGTMVGAIVEHDRYILHLYR